MSADNNWPWSVLGLDGPPDDPKEVRRAYARCLKQIDQSSDIAGFEALRKAYEFAKMRVGDKNAMRRKSVVADALSVPAGPLGPAPYRKPIDRFTPPSTDASETTPPAEPKEKTRLKATPPPQPAHTSKDVAPAETQKTPSPWAQSVLDLTDPQVVMNEAWRLSSSKTFEGESWLRLIKAPALSDPNCSSEVQRLLIESIRTIGGAAALPLGRTSRDFLADVDTRFEWVSDGVGFLRRFPYARVLQADMARMLNERKTPSNTNMQNRYNKYGRPLPHWIWSATFVGWLIIMDMS